MATKEITSAEQDYLEILFWLEEAKLPITGANIARAMNLSPPTVHEMLGRLEKDGFIDRSGGGKKITFTEEGREQAASFVRRHRLIERFLTDILGIPWHDCHEEAERLEHGMSPVLEERMLAALGPEARTCPHGHPFVEGAREPGAPLSDVEVGGRVRVLRFENEAEDVLHYLYDAGLEVGLEGTVTGTGEEVAVDAGGKAISVSKEIAETVSVKADPMPPERTGLPPEQLDLAKSKYGR